VRTPDQAADIARVADGVVVGSAIVELIAEHRENAPQYVEAFVASLRRAMDAARNPEESSQ
jgi:tryptophan synthase alpha chain